MKLQPVAAKKNAIFLLMAESGTKLLSLFAFAAMARGLSEQSYGVVALAFSVGSLFYIFFNLGLEQHIVRDAKRLLCSDDHVGLQKLFATVVTIKVWLLPISLLALFVVFTLMRWELAHLPVLYGIFLYFYFLSATQLLFFFFRAFEQMRYELVFRTLQAGIVLGIAVVFGYVFPSVRLLAFCYAGAAGVVLLSALTFFLRKTDLIFQLRRGFHSEEVSLVGKVRYLFFIGVATSIFSGVDTFVISKVQDVAAVGVYRNAVMMTFALFLFPTAIVQAFFPRLVQPLDQLDIFFHTVKQLLVRLVPLGVVVAGACYLIAPIFIPWFFGARYAATVPFFQVSLFAFLFATVNQVFGYGMIALGRYRPYFLITLVVSIVSVVLNLILIPRIGLWGGIFSLNVTHALLVLLPLGYLYALRVRVTTEGNTPL
ncbi:MAG: oligosaccharide flippase family protein [Candidatus Uhrbacteria bacterium]